MRISALSTFLLLVSIPAYASGPQLSELRPRGAQRGSVFALTLVGTGLSEEAQVLTNLPGTLTRLTPSRDPMRRGLELPFIVELDPDAPIDLYPIRVQTRDGLTKLLFFSVGAFPHVTEEESDNDSRETAQTVEVPVTVNGTLDGADRDWYRFHGEAGQRLVFEAEARRAGSGVDPVIRVVDTAGEVIARNDDARGLGVDSRLEITLPKQAEYYVELHDSKFSEQEENFYRLKIGTFTYAEAIFPLGWKRGAEVEVELSGGNLPQPVKVRPDLATLAETANFTSIAAPGEAGSLPFRFVVSDGTETLEPPGTAVKTLEPSTVVNGRISEPAEVDRYRLAVSPGEYWQFELSAASLGTSQLYALLSVHDSGGKKLVSAGATKPEQSPFAVVFSTTTGEDPSMSLTIPEQVHEVQLSVEDLLGRGGGSYGYRLLAKKGEPDFTLRLTTPYINIPLSGSASATVIANRRGYSGPIQLSIPNLPDDLVFDGGNIAVRPNVSGAAQSLSFRKASFTLTPKPGATPRALDLTVWGEGVTESGEIIRRPARGPGLVTAIEGANQEPFVAPWLNMDLPAMVVKEQPTTLEILTPRYVRLILGMEHDLKWKFIPRQPGIPPPQEIDQDFAPSSFGLNQTNTEKGLDHGVFTVLTTERTRPGRFDSVLSGEISVDGRKEIVTAPAVTFEIVRGFQIHVPTEVNVRLGASTQLAGRVQREPEFFSPVTIRVDNLPLHVSCPTVEVPGDVEQFQLICQAEATAEPGEYKIEIASSSELATRRAKKVPLRIPPVKARLIVPE